MPLDKDKAEVYQLLADVFCKVLIVVVILAAFVVLVIFFGKGPQPLSRSGYSHPTSNACDHPQALLLRAKAPLATNR